MRALICILLLASCHRIVTRCDRAGGHRELRDCHPEPDCVDVPAWAEDSVNAPPHCGQICNALCVSESGAPLDMRRR